MLCRGRRRKQQTPGNTQKKLRNTSGAVARVLEQNGEERRMGRLLLVDNSRDLPPNGHHSNYRRINPYKPLLHN